MILVITEVSGALPCSGAFSITSFTHDVAKSAAERISDCPILEMYDILLIFILLWFDAYSAFVAYTCTISFVTSTGLMFLMMLLISGILMQFSAFTELSV